MLHVLPEPAATIVAAASFTGARKGELSRFSLGGLDGEQIRISQSSGAIHVTGAKARKSKAPVPVISQLAERLELHRELLRQSGGRFDVPKSSWDTNQRRRARPWMSYGLR